MLHGLIGKIWDQESIPSEWKEGLLVKLPKKGDLSLCKNYRGIMLLSTAGKVLNRIILERMREAVDETLRDNQAGFRQSRSTSDQIATLRIIVEQSLEWRTPLYIKFIDYEKAFDSLDRNTLWYLMASYGIPGKIISLVKNTYEGTSCRILHDSGLTETFSIKTGVRQGCLLSPFLFLLAIDWAMKETTSDSRNGIQWTLVDQLEDLDFADDLALLSHTHSQMQAKTLKLEAISSKVGLKVNTDKTKIMGLNSKSNEHISITNRDLEDVTSFTYLGSVINITGGTDEDVLARIGKARSAFNILGNIWRSREITTATKIRIFNSNVKPVLLYGSETWRMTENTVSKLQTFVNRCLRRILQIYWPDTINNATLWESTGQLPVKEQIKKRKWTWIGHILRRPNTCLARQALGWNPQGSRRRGRPRNTWKRDTEKTIQLKGYTWNQIEQMARDRGGWRRFICGLCSETEY